MTASRRFLRKILVPIDGSESSLNAEETAAMIAKKAQTTVTVMHVIPYSLVLTKFMAGYQIPVVIRDEIVGHLEEQAEKVIGEAQDFFRKKGVTVGTHSVKFSDVAHSILRFSRDAYDLVIMGSRGENEKDPYALGSVTKKVVRSSPSRTLIAKKVSSLSNMLVCIDGSEHSVNALNYAIKLGDRMESKITLINVGDRQLREVSPKAAEELAKQILLKAIRATRKRGLEIDQIVEFGVPQDTVVEVAEKGGYDLIVLSSRGLGTVRRFLLGSVSDDVINKARCSVLVIPPRGRERL